MVSMMIVPAEVVTAQAEYSVCPRKYRLSNTLTGSAYQVLRSGGPGRLAAAPPRPRAGVEAAVRVASLQTRLKMPSHSCPAAVFAALTCADTRALPPWPLIDTPSANERATATTV